MVYQMIVEGYARCQIIRYSSENQWDVSDRTIDVYISAAREMIQSVNLDDIKKLLKSKIMELDHIRARAHNKGELTTAIEAIKETNKLLGMYPEEKTRHILEGKVQTEDVKSINWSKVPTEMLIKFMEKSSGT